MLSQKSEFTVSDAYQFNRRNALLWILSHIWRYRLYALTTFVMYVLTYFAFSQSSVFFGRAVEAVVTDGDRTQLLNIALIILLLRVADGACSLIGGLAGEVVAQNFEADARQELYASLLEKSQTFHDRQRVGDIMARATEDVRQLNGMISPGVNFIYETFLGFLIPITLIGFIDWRLMAVPLVFTLVYIVAVRDYFKRLSPAITNQRLEFGLMNATLEESISGIEVVKASTTEDFERLKFRRRAKAFRDYFVKQGQVEAAYMPILLYAISVGFVFLHGVSLYLGQEIRLGDLIALMGVYNVVSFPAFISLFSLSLLQNGYAGAKRILNIIKAETDLDQNENGISKTVEGEITFENVTFGYVPERPVLSNISFTIKAGETVAVVGQTGSGKSSLTQLINRAYDVDEGRVLIDGIDVRDWNLAALRPQISKIEQDIFLFSRTIAENIAFGAPNTPQEQIEAAAKAAQAHDFIMSFQDGYQTKIGERGVTLSGGQRQRIALARAFLSNPRILILDDSTSAIDSATEDEIQKALLKMQEGRTTILITHRLSQIRWADHILVLEAGRLVAYGTHEELLRTSPHYRRIFARYDVALPPLEAEITPEQPIAGSMP